MQRLLKDHGLDVFIPQARPAPGHYWVQLRNGPYSLQHNLPLLKKASLTMHHLQALTEEFEPKRVLVKLDGTRDLKGLFYAQDNWRPLHRQLATALEA